MIKYFFAIMLMLAVSLPGYSQTMQATFKKSAIPKTVDIYLKPSTSFSQKDEAATFTVAVPATILPAPFIGTTGATANTTGFVTAITGLQPNILLNNLGSTSREIVTTMQFINGTPYYIYTFIFAGTAATNHDWTGTVEQLVYSIQFLGCSANCESSILMVSLANGGSQGNSYFYFQPNTVGDVTNYAAPFYPSGQTNPPVSSVVGGATQHLIGFVSPITLPVTLTSFQLEAWNCKTKLNWKTTQEVNTQYFDIRRSSDGINFSSIGTVSAAGNSSSEKAYSFLDVNAPKGSLHYQLKTIDQDGKFTLSSIKSIDLRCSRHIKVFPTFSRGLVNVSFQANEEPLFIKVFNSTGQTILQKKLFRGQGSFDLSYAPAGLYFVRATTGGLMEEFKFYIAH